MKQIKLTRCDLGECSWGKYYIQNPHRMDPEDADRQWYITTEKRGDGPYGPFDTLREAKEWLAEHGDDVRCIAFEYDMEFADGNYSKVGEFAYVPLALCEELGEEETFEKHTGIDRVHIVHYSSDEIMDQEGNILDE